MNMRSRPNDDGRDAMTYSPMNSPALKRRFALFCRELHELFIVDLRDLPYPWLVH